MTTDQTGGVQLNGCPVIHMETGIERPVGEWLQYFADLREGSPYYWNENGGYWVLTRSNQVREVFQNPQVFTNDSVSPADPDPPYKWIPSNINPPTHVEYRQILNHAFGPAAVARMEPTAREYCRLTIDEFFDKGSCEFMTEFAGVYPTRVFLKMIDLPWEEAPFFVGLVEQIFNGLFGLNGRGIDDVVAAMGEIRTYFENLIEDRRRSPRDRMEDFLTYVMSSSIAGEPITDDDVLNIFNQLVLAGLDTVKSQLGYALLHLATNPEDRARVLREPEVIPTAIEEFLRAYPLIMDGRKVGEDTDFHGCPMKKGQMVMLVLPAALRDPRTVEQPEEVILDRQRNNHMAFGAGPHRCLGSHLTRMEMAVALEEWHRRIPEYRLAIDVDKVMERGGQLALRSLPLVWA